MNFPSPPAQIAWRISVASVWMSGAQPTRDASCSRLPVAVAGAACSPADRSPTAPAPPRPRPRPAPLGSIPSSPPIGPGRRREGGRRRPPPAPVTGSPALLAAVDAVDGLAHEPVVEHVDEVGVGGDRLFALLRGGVPPRPVC